MPSLSDDPARHVVIDRRQGHYIAFPDVIRAKDGTLVVAYNEADKHVRPERRAVAVKLSRDNGATWSDVIYPDSPRSHCPRIYGFPDGELLISDSSLVFHASRDNGSTWAPLPVDGLSLDMHDRVLHLGGDVFLTTGHTHVGEEHPAIRQPPTRQVVFRSTDRCRSWEEFSILAEHRNLVLCEASMVRLPDNRILALLRENSFVFEPMYACISADDGASWSAPMPTPLIGHRPTMGLTSDNRLLVTYRNTGPDWGTCAWQGTLDELLSDYRVHGRAVASDNPIFTAQGMRVRNEAGNQSVVRYALRPLTDPRTATATLEAEVRVDSADENGCAIRMGTWWRITPDAIMPEAENATPVRIEPGRFNTIRLVYADGTVTLRVNGEKAAAIKVDPDHADTRPVMLGAPYPFENNAVDCTWKRVRLNIMEPAYEREYTWNWESDDGLPDQWVQDNILELRNDRHAAAPDFGYSGWCELDDGKFFSVYHHGGGTEDGYEPLHSSHIAGTWFSLDDFSKE